MEPSEYGMWRRVRGSQHSVKVTCVFGHSRLAPTARRWLPELKATRNDRIDLYDVGKGRKQGSLIGHSDCIYGVAFSPDGRIVASGSRDFTTKLWNPTTGKNLATLTVSPVEYVGSVAFSPDGKTLASGLRDGRIILWDVASRKKKATLRSHNYLSSVAFSANGKTLAAGHLDKTIELWEVTNARIVTTLCGHSNGVRCVAFSPDGRMLASASADRTVKLWDVREACRRGTQTDYDKIGK